MKEGVNGMKKGVFIVLSLALCVSLAHTSSVLRKYGVATTIYFPLIDENGVDFDAVPVTFAAGDCQFRSDVRQLQWHAGP
jgi:hypothetical protein